MQSNHLTKAALLMLVVVISFIFCWEWYWRGRGFKVSYNDDEKLWAMKRKQVYQSPTQATVFIGSSRIKFDLDLPTWQNLTGNTPIQLSMVGTSPRPLLHDLATDENFKGRLIIDVTEPLFFSRNTMRTNRSAMKGINFYKTATPAQRVSSYLNVALESQLSFLEEDKFSLNKLLDEISIPNRKGVFAPPVFPKEFEVANFDRQTSMTPMFVGSKSLQQKQINNWIILGALDKKPAIKGDSLEAVFKSIKADIDKIKARGGTVLFVRTPSSGGYLETERIVYPRNQYWDRLLTYTNTPGIHFEDYPETAHFICPEWSHLTPGDAIIYTKHFVNILQEKGWKFQKEKSVK